MYIWIDTYLVNIISKYLDRYLKVYKNFFYSPQSVFFNVSLVIYSNNSSNAIVLFYYS